MAFLGKHRVEIALFILITGVLFISRVYHILELPIFTDEAIYTRWAQIAKQDANWRFISLTDGKQPMFVWLDIISMHIVGEPLLAGRLVSAFAGFFSMLGLFFLGMTLFKSRFVGFISAVLYLIYPFALVYDRMALYDGLVGAFSVWGLYLIVLLVRKVRLDIALILGMVLGGGVITKTTGFLNIFLLPLSLILFDFRKDQRNLRLLKWVSLAFLAVALAHGYYSILRLSPFFHIISEKNELFVYPLKEWITHPFTFFVGNWKALWDWVTLYMTWPILILATVSFFIKRTFTREKLFLFSFFIIPIVGLALFGRTLYPRFTFFMTLPLLPLVAFSLASIYAALKNRIAFAILFCLIFFLQLRSDYFILNDFKDAPIPGSDLQQYSNDWPAGGGIKESVRFFEEQAKKGKIYIGTQGTFGLLPYGLEIYLAKNPNITIQGFWPVENQIPQEVFEESKKVATYFVFYQPCSSCMASGIAPASWKGIRLVNRYKKPYGERYFSVYQVMP